MTAYQRALRERVRRLVLSGNLMDLRAGAALRDLILDDPEAAEREIEAIEERARHLTDLPH